MINYPYKFAPIYVYLPQVPVAKNRYDVIVEDGDIKSFVDFATWFDDQFHTSIEKREQEYLRGVYVGNNATVVMLNATLVWYSDNKDGSFTSSYERLGCHACTQYFFAGLIASGVKITFRFKGEDKVIQQ